jgi:phytoene dehydrogenase-like protein
MDPLLDTVPPEAAVGESSLAVRMADGWSKSKVLGSLLKRSSKLKQHEITSFMELLLAPASKVLNNWFELDVLRATLATDAVIGAMVHHPTCVNPLKLTAKGTVVSLNDVSSTGRPVCTRLAVDTCFCIT